MTDETVDCHNCGRPNPEWAQVCRSCGVGLRHGEARTVPAGPFPTDRDSLISMGAVIGTILAAVFVGLFISGLNPTESGVGQATPTPSATVEPTGTPEPEPEPEPTATPEPELTATPEPELPGTLSFGTGLDDNRQVTGETETFTPADNFAYSLSVPGGLGGDSIRNEVARTSDPAEVVSDEAIPADPNAEVVAYNLGGASTFVAAWGPGEYVWRIYVGGELVAETPFRLAEG